MPPSFQCFLFLLNWMRCNSSAHGVRLTAATHCMDIPEILYLRELSESLPQAESLSFFTSGHWARVPKLGLQAPRPWTLKPPCRFRGPEPKHFPSCFLPLPRLPTVLCYFWPLVSESCFVRRSPDTAKKCSQFKWASGEKARDRQELKETVQ